jgi:acetolactate synthase-1/2/3 large subunit
MLRDYKVRYVLGMPGGQHFPIYAGIAALRPAIDHVGFRCEKNAAFAAYAYAQVTGKPGICDATVGPGVTNLASGIAEAWAASIPVIAISGDVPTWAVGKWAAQEMDTRSVLRPFTKAVLRVERADKIPETIRMAFRLATSGRPGPVHLIFPADILADEIQGADLAVEERCSVFPSQRPGADPRAIVEASELLVAAQRPLLFAGGGVLTSGASGELIALAELLSAPVATSMMGKGSIPEDHPLSLGAAVTFNGPQLTYQMRGHRIVAESDLVVFVGTRTDEAATAMWTMPRPGIRAIHIDIDPAEIGRNYPVDVAIVADAKLALQALLDELRGRALATDRTERHQAVLHASQEWRRAVRPKLESNEVPITGHRVVRELRAVLDSDAVLVTDASLVPYLAAAFVDARRAGRTFVSPRGLGSLGSSLPMVIGAKLGAPERTVVGFGGDGGFAMALAELETARRSGLKVTYVLLNNSALGYSAMTLEPDISMHFEPVAYADVAKAFGWLGLQVHHPDELADALRVALQADEPALVEVVSAIELPTTAGGLQIHRDAV